MANGTNGLRTFSLGLQHVLAMYAGAILVPLIVGRALELSAEQLAYLVAIDLLSCGVATLLQLWRGKHIGIGLPVMLGVSFVAVTPMISIGTNYGVTAIYGSILVAGLFVVIFARFFGKLQKLFPPIVRGTVVTIIGLSLIPTGIRNMAGGEGSENFGSLFNLLLSVGVLAVIILLFRMFTGFMRSLAVLIGIAGGTIAAAVMGQVSFGEVMEASWFHFPQPLYFGMPTFEIGPIITMIIVCSVIVVETTGAYYAVARITDRELNEDDLVRGYRSEGLAVIIGGLFNAFPYSTFAQNVGLLELSKVKTRNVIFSAAMTLIVLGLIPKVAALVVIIPTPVLGGATVVMFGMVVVAGLQMLRDVDFNEQSNQLVVACSVSLALGATVVPELFSSLPEGLAIIFGDGIITGSLAAIFINLLFNARWKGEHVYNEEKESKA